MTELRDRFFAALNSVYGPRKLSAALSIIAVLIWKARVDASWRQLASELSHALEAAGQPPITDATLRGMMGRKRRIGRAAIPRAQFEPSPGAATTATASQTGSLEPTSTASPSLGHIEQVALRRSRIRALDRESN